METDIFKLKLDTSAWKKCARELEDFTGKSIVDLEDSYKSTLAAEEEEEKSLYNAQNRRDVEEYYRQTPRYLYELMRWEGTFDKQCNFKRLSIFLRKNRIKHVLDFGGGVGGLSIYLAGVSIQCHYMDVLGKNFEFAQWRFKSRGFDIKMFDALKELPQGKYSAIVAYDVLEHIPDVEKSIGRLSNMLEPNGVFLTKSTFSGGGLHLKENEIFSDMSRFNNLLQKFGLSYAGRIKNSYFSDALERIGVPIVTGIRVSRIVKYGGNFLIHRKAA